jgi:hypothetical protein
MVGNMGTTEIQNLLKKISSNIGDRKKKIK